MHCTLPTPQNPMNDLEVQRHEEDEQKSFYIPDVKTLVRSDAIRQRLHGACSCGEAELLRRYGTPENGLSEKLADRARAEYGTNVLTYGKKGIHYKSGFFRLYQSLHQWSCWSWPPSPFYGHPFAEPGDRNYVTVVIITVMVPSLRRAALRTGDPQRKRCPNS